MMDVDYFIISPKNKEYTRINKEVGFDVLHHGRDISSATAGEAFRGGTPEAKMMQRGYAYGVSVDSLCDSRIAYLERRLFLSSDIKGIPKCDEILEGTIEPWLRITNWIKRRHDDQAMLVISNGPLYGNVLRWIQLTYKETDQACRAMRSQAHPPRETVPDGHHRCCS